MQRNKFKNNYWLQISIAFVLTSCGSQNPSSHEINTEDCAMAVVNSDYMSASISLLDSSGDLCHDNLLHSGTVQPGLATALSGDVVPASSQHPGGFMTLIDRFPNGVVSLIAPTTGQVISQVSVSPGFAANPQDVAFLSDGRAYISRAEKNTTPTPQTDDYDDGGDLVILDLETNQLTGRIDLANQASLDVDGNLLNPRPGRMVAHDKHVWVSLENLSYDFKQAGPGLVVLVDPETDQVAHRLELDTFQNCTRILGVKEGVWVACSGNFGATYDQQLAGSGVGFITMSSAGPTITWQARASKLGNRPLGYGIAAVGEHKLAYILVGDLDPANKVKDCIHIVDRRSSKAQNLHIKNTAYTIGDIAWLPENSILMALVGNNENPGVARRQLTFGKDEIELSELPWVNSNPAVGLPPRTLGVIK